MTIDLFKIGDLDLGTEIILNVVSNYFDYVGDFPSNYDKYSPNCLIPGTIIGTNDGSKICINVLVGFDQKYSVDYYSIGWHISNNDTRLHEFSRLELNNAKFAWMVRKDIIVGVQRKAIISPNQVCSLCKIPAPHTKPNKNKEFVCISCKVFEEIL